VNLDGMKCNSRVLTCLFHYISLGGVRMSANFGGKGWRERERAVVLDAPLSSLSSSSP